MSPTPVGPWGWAAGLSVAPCPAQRDAARLHRAAAAAGAAWTAPPSSGGGYAPVEMEKKNVIGSY